MGLAICLAAIVISVGIGWKWKLNTGVIAMCFAFFIGYFMLGKKVGDVINLWPTNITFYLIAIALLFNYATINGTMEVLSKKLLSFMGGRAALIPWAVTAVCAVVGGLGAGASTPALIGPFAFSMGISAGISPMLTGVCIAFGNLIGSNNPYNGYGGVIGRNLIVENGESARAAAKIGQLVWVNSSIMCVLVILLFYLFCRAYRAKSVRTEKAPDFSPVQKKTMLIISVSFVAMVVPGIMHTWIASPFWGMLSGICQPQVVMVTAAFLCSVLKLAPEREVVKTIPIHTIIMIAGVYMLIKVSVEAGLIEAISVILTRNIPRLLVPGAIVLLAAFLSFFSSSTSTVMPLMYPLVPYLAEHMGLNPVTLYTCIFFGGLSTAISPFSTGGALTIASYPDQNGKEGLVNQMIACAFVIPVVTIIAAELGLFSLFHI